MAARALVLVVIGCGHATPPPTTPTVPTPVGNAPSTAPATSDAAAVPLPEEPWYRTNPEHTDECVAALPAVPARHFPAPFEACDPREESWSSPPGGSELHFHYRIFSAALTKTRRAKTAGTCCYMVWEFPR